MTTLPGIIMYIRWEKQQRLIKILETDTLDSIEQAICDAFDWKSVDVLHNYQIQFYNRDAERFLDLYKETMDLFNELVQRLSSVNAPRKSAKEWLLKIIPKAKPISRQSSLFEDDTWNYQQVNDTENVLVKDQQTTGIYTSQESILSENGDETPIALNETNNDESLAGNQNPPESPIDPNEVNPIHVSFELDVSNNYRLQYETDATRSKSSAVWLHAVNQEHVADREKKYPTLKINIPENKHHLEWTLQLYVLTQADKSGYYYLHPSQGIFDKTRDSAQNQVGAMENSKLVNPYVIKLSKDDLCKGMKELSLKICNTSGWSQRKMQLLKMFGQSTGDRSNRPRLLISADKQALSRFSAKDLNLTKNHCHVGCVLISKSRIYNACISQLIIEEKKRSSSQIDTGHREKQSKIS